MTMRKLLTATEKQAEELKRERSCDPLQRWIAIQNAIAFAEKNVPAERRRNRPRWHAYTRFRDTPDGPFVHAAASPSPRNPCAK